MRLDKKTADQVLAAVQRGKHTWNYLTKSSDNDIGEFESKEARLAIRMLEEAEQKEAAQKEAHRKRQRSISGQIARISISYKVDSDWNLRSVCRTLRCMWRMADLSDEGCVAASRNNRAGFGGDRAIAIE